MSIEIRNIRKSFGDFAALKDVSFKVETGELVALLGPSGSGQDHALANYRRDRSSRRPNDGAILIHNEDTTAISFRDRRVGFVFQHYALFRHMTIFENVAFGLRVRPRRLRPSEKVIKEKVNELLKLVQLDWLGDRYAIPTFRRAAAANRVGARSRGGAERAASGRALRFPRRQSPKRAAPVAQALSR